MTSKLYVTETLRLWRQAKGYTQEEMRSLFSLDTGKDVSFSTYQKWEQGTLYITPDFALELSRFTRIELKDLVERK